jgi:hypothetical protein
MWLLLNDAFLSIVHKDCERGEVVVRARRPRDIERVFGRRIFVIEQPGTDYRYRAVVTKAALKAALAQEVDRINYPNFKSSVTDDQLHMAYLNCWMTLAKLQPPQRPIDLSDIPEADEEWFRTAKVLKPKPKKRGKR